MENKYIGIIFAIAGNLMISFSFNIQKVCHLLQRRNSYLLCTGGPINSTQERRGLYESSLVVWLIAVKKLSPFLN